MRKAIVAGGEGGADDGACSSETGISTSTVPTLYGPEYAGKAGVIPREGIHMAGRFVRFTGALLVEFWRARRNDAVVADGIVQRITMREVNEPYYGGNVNRKSS